MIAMLVCWAVAAILGGAYGLLLRSMRAEGEKESGAGVMEETPGAEYYETLCACWRGLRLANERDRSKRVALINLSTAIWKIGQGEWVEPKVLDYLLGQLNGGAGVLEKIKGDGA